MNEVFEWVGFVCVTGCVGLIAALVWYQAWRYAARGSKEFWWIVTYAAWKKRNGGKQAAKRALRTAIEADKKRHEGPNQ